MPPAPELAFVRRFRNEYARRVYQSPAQCLIGAVRDRRPCMWYRVGCRVNVNARFLFFSRRRSGKRLLDAALYGIKAFGGTVEDFGVITTPMLHFFVRCSNTNGLYGEPNERSYYAKLTDGFKTMRKMASAPVRRCLALTSALLTGPFIIFFLLVFGFQKLPARNRIRRRERGGRFENERRHRVFGRHADRERAQRRHGGHGETEFPSNEETLPVDGFSVFMDGCVYILVRRGLREIEPTSSHRCHR